MVDQNYRIREAQARYHYKKFVLIGLCSGADDALATAEPDNRVNGVVLLNGYAYPAGRFKLNQFKEFYVPRLLNIDKWKFELGKVLSRKAAISAIVPAATLEVTQINANADSAIDAEEQAAIKALDDDYRHIPPKGETGKIIQTLSTDGVWLYFIVCGFNP